MREVNRRHGFWYVTGSIITGVIIAAAFAVVFGALVMVLWNWLLPGIFGLGTIGYWQGFGLVLLAKLLFGGTGYKGTGTDRHKYADKYWYRKYDGYWHTPHKKHEHNWHEHNWHFDDVYEDWWEKEGAASFEAFMKKNESDQDDNAGDKKEES